MPSLVCLVPLPPFEEFYIKGQTVRDGKVKKTVQGGKHMQETAAYPVRFCRALVHCWLAAKQNKQMKQ